LALFGKKKASEDIAPEDNGREFTHDLRRAGKFYEHARSTADARNYDYSVECYINGLKFDPDNHSIHEELREVSLKRRVSGGKPKRGGSLGKDPISKMLDAEKAMAFDPLNARNIVATVERLVDVDEAYDNLALGDTADWMGRQALELIRGAKKPDKKLCTRLMEALQRLNAYEMACHACRVAIQIDPEDIELVAELGRLEAELAIVRGRYDEASTDAVRDKDQMQKLMDLDDRTSGREDVKERIVEAARVEFEQEPTNLDIRLKLVDALRSRDTVEAEVEAIRLLEEGYEQTSQYRLKTMIGDIRIKQLTRNLREKREELKKKPDSDDLKTRFNEAARQLLAFKLQEFAERVKNYPTNMQIRYEYGVCLFQAGKIEESIGAFQQSQQDPKVRNHSRLFLGRAYLHQQWYDEAIDTLQAGVEGYEMKDDTLAKELRYYLMDALEHKAREDNSLDHAQRAREVASNLLQTDINFRDIKDRINAIRDLINKLRDGNNQ